MAYDAFISYSHAADQRLAAALERALQGFARPWNKRRALDIFRDEGNLNLSDHLWGSIQQALDTSRFFIYVASPQAAASHWVSKEIKYWIGHRERRRLIVLWTDGTLGWDNVSNDYAPGLSTAVPDALRGVFEGEPLYLDMRWTRDEQDLTLANDRFKKHVVQLAATLREIAVEDMVGEEAEQYRRALKIRNLTIAGLTMLTIAAFVAAGVALMARRAAVRSEERATSEQQRAEQAAANAEARRRDAEAATGRAEKSETLANERAEEAARQKAIADKEARAAQIALARVSTQEGRRMMDAGRTGEALAYFARALRNDHESTAVSWVSSILANGRLWIPGLPLRHSAAVQSVAFAPDGRRVVTGSADGTARIWDSVTSEPIGVPLQHKDAIRAVAFSPDGNRVLTASSDWTARLWDARTGRPLDITLQHRYSLSSAAFSPDGKRIVTTSNDSTAIIWDAETGRLVAGPLKHQEPIDSATFSPDGRLVVTAGSDRIAQIWETATGKPVGPPLRHGGDVYTARFSPDGRLIVTAASNRVAQLWDVKTGVQVGKPMQHGGFVAVADFSPDGTRIMTASYDGTARIWDAATQQALSDPLEHGAIVHYATFSPDGRYLLTVSRDSTARVWNVTTGLAAGPPLQHQDTVSAAAFSPDGSTIITASSDSTARLWRAVAQSDGERLLRHEAPVTDAQFSRDGRSIVTLSNNTAVVWDATSGALRTAFKSNAKIASVGLSDDGKFVLIAASGPALMPADRQVGVWDIATGRFVGSSATDGPKLWPSSFTRDGRRVAVGGSIADSASGKVVSVVDAESSTSALSPDGGLLATTREFEVRLWDVRNGKRAGGTLPRRERIHRLAFSPDGRQLAVGHTDDSARLWDTTTREPVGVALQNRPDARLQVLEGVAVAFSPDGRRIATASGSDYARVWDTSSGGPVSPVLPHRADVYRASFSADSRRLVTASLDRTARIWTVLTGDGTPASAAVLADVAELVGGVRLSEKGTVTALDRQDLQRRLQGLAATPSSLREIQPLLSSLVAMGSGIRRH